MPTQPSDSSKDPGHTILVMVLCLLPLVVLALVLTNGVQVSPWLFFVFLLLCFFGMYHAMGPHEVREASNDASNGHEPVSATPAVPEAVILRVADVMDPLSSYREANHYVIEGSLLEEPDVAYEKLQQRFAGTELTPLLQENSQGRPVLVITSSEAQDASARQPSRGWVNLALLIGTLATTTWAGAAHQGIDLLAQPGKYVAGLPYALALMLILGIHELGHYVTARKNGMIVSWPYFIPVPFALGTFGAFIRMKSQARDRRAMFDVAVAGPIGGLIVAIPALLIGLRLSTVTSGTAETSMFMGGSEVGSSVLFAFLAKVALGDTLLLGHRLILHPVAFAGWLGLLVTALNLIPVGQLDGGHMAHALLGRATAHTVGVVSLVSLVVLGLFVWSGLLFWAILIFFIAGTRDVPPRNDVSEVGRGRVVMGAAAFVLLLLILLPIPHALYTSFGIHCPYV